MSATLALASHTGWTEQAIQSMRSSRFLKYLDKLPKNDG